MARDTRPAKSLNSAQRLARIEEMEYDARVLREQYEGELAKLRNQVVNLEAELKTLRIGATVNDHGRRYAPVALTEAQSQSVWDLVNSAVSNSFGDGDWLTGNYKDGGQYEHVVFEEDWLPGFGGFIARGDASDAAGWFMGQIWGLVQVPQPCPDCKKPTLPTRYQSCCQPCQEKREVQYALTDAHSEGKHKDQPHPECSWCKD